MSDHTAPNVQELSTQATHRRQFLRNGALAALAAGTLAACRKGGSEAQAAPNNAHAMGSTPTPPPAPRMSPCEKADQMDRMHEAGIKAFPAKTAGKVNQLMAPRLDKNVKVYDLTATEIDWEVEPGKRVKAMAYNDQVPGPQIR